MAQGARSEVKPRPARPPAWHLTEEESDMITYTVTVKPNSNAFAAIQRFVPEDEALMILPRITCAGDESGVD